MRIKTLLMGAACLSGCFCTSLQAQVLPYKDASLPVERRVQDLLERMTLDEKFAQIRHIHSENIFNDQLLDKEKLASFCGDIGWGFVEGFPLKSENCKKNFLEVQKYMVEHTRLGIPVFVTAESLHGMVHDGATIFPQNIALGSTFNPELAYLKTSAISDELHAAGIQQVLSPCIDVVRDLRWGRVEESFGEDPLLCGLMGIAEVKGYMDHGISPMLKHYGPHGNPLGGLNLASVDCGTRDLLDIYLKPFEMVLQHTDIMAVMSSYNSWNRVPNSASRYMLTELLRNKWGFKGYVYSDWGVIDMLKSFHYSAADNESAARQVMDAGLDVEASSNCFPALQAAVERGEYDLRKIDTAVARVLAAKMKAGLFEDPYGERFTAGMIRSADKVALSRRIADESTVLLKNENNLLPLDPAKLKSIAVIGPNADHVQFGDYTWSKGNEDGITPLSGIKALVGDKVAIRYAYGCGLASLDTLHIREAVEAARESDVAVIFCGSSSTVFVRSSENPSTSGEGMDLNDISLTGAQEQLIEAVYATGKPVVVVLVAGKPFAIPWVKEHIPAVLAQWYAGEQAGASIADILFGKVNPSGKTSFSFPQSTGHLPVYYNHLTTDKGYYKHPGTYDKPGRDYVFSSPDPLWAFGHGLSYTTFGYTKASTDKPRYSETDTIRVSVQLRNEGNREGKEVVQVYVRDVVSTIMSPVRQLKGFQKISLAPRQMQECEIKIPVQELCLLDEAGNRFIEPGVFHIEVGAASDDIRFVLPVTVGDYTVKAETKEKQEGQLQKQGAMIRVEGVVRDIQATPVAGVEVAARAGGVKVMTDKRGHYAIEVDEYDTLTFTKAGFGQQSLPVNSSKYLNVKMNYSKE